MSNAAPVPMSESLAWKIVLAIGLVHVFMGAALLFWPSATLTVVVVIVGIELVLAGVLRMLVAAGDAQLDARLLRALLGLMSVVVGLLVMREPLRSLAVVVGLLGVFWVVWGLVELFISLTPSASGTRLPLAVEGGVAVVGGLFLLAWPELTVRGLTILVGGFLLAGGLVVVWSAWQLRRPQARPIPGAISSPAPS
jgi:uncharacterized membrane protein HdeD (DUF308 family)